MKTEINQKNKGEQKKKKHKQTSNTEDKDTQQ